MKLVIRAQADAEYAETIAHYVLEETPQSAERFEKAIKKALAEIEQAPFLFREREDGLRFKPVKKFPYEILYAVEHDEIIVVAYKHYARKTGYWRD